MKNGNLEKIEKIVSDERCNLFLVKENLSVLKFLLDDPEKIEDNTDLLFGIRNIIEFSHGQLSESINNLDIPLDLFNIK